MFPPRCSLKNSVHNYRQLETRVSAIGSTPQAFGKWPFQLAKTDLLVLDDWGMGAIDGMTRSDLLEIIDDRTGNKATIITSQLHVEHWHAWIRFAWARHAAIGKPATLPVSIIR